MLTHTKYTKAPSIPEHITGSPYNSVEYYPPGHTGRLTDNPPCYPPRASTEEYLPVWITNGYQEYLKRHHPKKEWANVASVPPALTKYYNVGGIEVIDYIKAKLTKEQYKGYLLGNIYKYSGRLQYKGEEAKDIKKLVEYTTWLKEHNANHA